MRPGNYKRLRSLVAAALAALVTGCAVLYDARDDIAGIPSGASKVQVSAALGAPARIVSKGDREAWLYCRKSELVDRFIVAVFKGSTLESVRQNPEFEFGACERFFGEVTLTAAGG